MYPRIIFTIQISARRELEDGNASDSVQAAKTLANGIADAEAGPLASNCQKVVNGYGIVVSRMI